jgi:hypothetical protein
MTMKVISIITTNDTSVKEDFVPTSTGDVTSISKITCTTLFKVYQNVVMVTEAKVFIIIKPQLLLLLRD